MAEEYLFRRTKDRRLAPWQPFTFPRPMIPDGEIPRGVQLLPDRVYAAKSYSPWVPLLAPKLVIPDGERPVGVNLLPDRAYAPKALPWSAYALAVPRQVDEQLPRGVVLFPDRAPPRPPAAPGDAYRIAYFHRGTPPEPPPDPAVGKAFFTERVYPYPLARKEAYAAGGGNEDWTAFGAALPGCPYLGERIEAIETVPTRPAPGQEVLPTKVESTPTLPIRPRRCC